MERNLTQGKVFRTLVTFSLPFLLSYCLQTLYGLVDLFIIGQFNGVESTTAVSVGSQVMHMVTVIVVGLAMGSTVLIGRAIGAQKRGEASAVIGNTVTLFIGFSIVAAAVLVILARPITSAMSTPADAVEGMVSYLTICFIGIPFITAYNVIASVLRGMGDSKSPMYFVAIACGANFILDLFFIGALKMGPSGAALGTVIAQAVSVIISLAIVSRRKTGLRVRREHLRPDKGIMLGLLKIGLPIAVQDGFIQIAFLIITVIANQRGLNDAAAVGIVEKIIGFLFLVPSTMLASVSAMGAQNVGAERHDRAKKTLLYAILICVVYALAAALVMQLAADRFVALFTSDATVTRFGGQYMRGYIWDCLFAGIHFTFSGYFCAYGRSIFSFIHNIISIVFARIPLAYLASKAYPETLFPMGLATATGSLVSVIVCLILFVWMMRRLKSGRAEQ